ncbi:MAG TPA: kelch repeat-containing protein, partial [Kofleriaceae bacterium]
MSRSLAIVVLGVLGAAACASTAAVADAPTSAWILGPLMLRRALDPGVTALGQELVVAGGFDVSPAGGLEVSAEVDVLDTVQLALAPAMWGRLPDAPVHWVGPNLAAIGGTLYLAGGLEGPGGAARGDAFALDPVDHLWHALPAMPAGEERGASGVVTAPGKIYLLGGASSNAAVATCLVYDTATRTW